MKRLLTAFALSYFATLLVIVAIAYANREAGQLVGKVIVSQELDVPDVQAGAYGNLDSKLPFFWAEIGSSKAIYAEVRQHSAYVPFFYLTMRPERRRYMNGLYVEAYDYDWSFQGAAFNKQLMTFFPIARDEIIKALRARGIVATPKGKIEVDEERSRTPRMVVILGSLIFIPSFLITVLIIRKTQANQAPLRMPGSVTPAADAPVAPPPGIAGL
jgi:hypothetical protein